VKKTFKQTDGSFVTIEGTAEEIRQYERIVESDRRGQEPKKQAPDVLKGNEAKGFQEIIAELRRQLGQQQEVQPVAPLLPWLPPMTSCLKCGRSPCACYSVYPGWPGYPYQIWCKTVTVSGDSTLPANTHEGFTGPGMY
jgi:hypothetical protein